MPRLRARKGDGGSDRSGEGELIPYNNSGNFSTTSPMQKINRKAVVSMARHLLRQAMDGSEDASVSTPDGSLGGSTTGSAYTSHSYYL